MKPLLLLAVAAPLALPMPARVDWRAEANKRIQLLRTGDFSVEVRGRDGAPLKGAPVEYRLKRHGFLFGTAVAYAPFADSGDAGKQYRQFILDNFSALVCENEMKWYRNEAQRGQEDYSQADALLAFAKQNGLAMRGHCLFWEKERYVQPWLAALDPIQLRAAVERRLASAVGRYAGQLAAWDVNNETLDGSFYRTRLGEDIVPWMFREAARLDPKTPLFLNEYGILGNDDKTERYIARVRDLRNDGARIGGLGIQSHDSDRLTASGDVKLAPGDRPEALLRTPLTPMIFLNTLTRLYSETGLPIHLTEVSAKVPDANQRAEALDMLFRLGFSHQAVRAIMLWGFGEKTHWMGADAALVNADGSLNAAGQRVSHLLREEWMTSGTAATGVDGRLAFHGFFGLYTLKVTLPDGRLVEQDIELTQSAPKGIVKLAE